MSVIELNKNKYNQEVDFKKSLEELSSMMDNLGDAAPWIPDGQIRRTVDFILAEFPRYKERLLVAYLQQTTIFAEECTHEVVVYDGHINYHTGVEHGEVYCKICGKHIKDY